MGVSKCGVAMRATALVFTLTAIIAFIVNYFDSVGYVDRFFNNYTSFDNNHITLMAMLSLVASFLALVTLIAPLVAGCCCSVSSRKIVFAVCLGLRFALVLVGIGCCGSVMVNVGTHVSPCGLMGTICLSVVFWLSIGETFTFCCAACKETDGVVVGQPQAQLGGQKQQYYPVAQQPLNVGQDQQLMGQQPMGQPPMGQQPMGQQPMGQQPMGQPPMGQQPAGQPPMGQPPMGQQPAGQPPMGQPPMGQQPMGQQPMGQQQMGLPYPMMKQELGQPQQPMGPPKAPVAGQQPAMTMPQPPPEAQLQAAGPDTTTSTSRSDRQPRRPDQDTTDT